MPILPSIFHAATAAAASAAGKAIHMPVGPKKRDRIHPRGTMIISWRRSEMIRDSFPRPMASNTPGTTMPAVEIRKLSPIMRSAGMPYSSSWLSASKSLRMGPGKKTAPIVPARVMTAVIPRLQRMVWRTRPCSPAP